MSTNSREGNIHAMWAFPLASLSSPSMVADAQFSVNVAAVPSNASFNADLYVIRIADSDAYSADDYQNFSSLIQEDFWKPANGTGALSADMTSELQGSSWSSSDFLIMGVKTDPLTLPPDVAQRWLQFDTLELSVTVIPEPCSLALLGGGLGFLLLARRLKLRA